MSLSYFKFKSLSNAVKAKHGIKAKARLDCISYTNPTGYTGLKAFVNGKGQMPLYKVAANKYVKSNSVRLSEWTLTNGNLNLSSIYFEDLDFPEYGYGYPNGNRLRSDGSINPMFPYRNDCYLFIFNKDLTEIEVIVIKNGRSQVTGYYQCLIDGTLEPKLQMLRSLSKPFYDYGSAL